MRNRFFLYYCISILVFGHALAQDAIYCKAQQDIDSLEHQISIKEDEIMSIARGIAKGKLLYNCEQGLLIDDCQSRRIDESNVEGSKRLMEETKAEIDTLRAFRSRKYDECFDELLLLSPPPKKWYDDVVDKIFE